MKFSGGSHKARAKYCVSQSALAKDEKIKKFWEDLADEWMAMNEQPVADSGQTTGVDVREALKSFLVKGAPSELPNE